MDVKKLKIGLIGLGARGSGLLESVLLPMEDVELPPSATFMMTAQPLR